MGVNEMHEALAILICALAVIGLYALFSRLAVFLLPHGSILLSIDGREHTAEEILLLTEYARFLAERERRLSPEISVLLNEDEFEKTMTLRKEGILVYTLKS